MKTVSRAYDTYRRCAAPRFPRWKPAAFPARREPRRQQACQRRICRRERDVRPPTGAGIGGVVGGGAGLLAGLGLLAIPGLGPVVAAGWLAATAVGAVAGATTGGVVGALVDAGVSEDDAHVYSDRSVVAARW